MVKIKTIIVLLCFFCLLNCKKQTEEIKLIEENYQNFEYNEELVLESTENYKNWKIKCKAIKCKISFIIGSTKKEEFFSKNITLNKNEKEKIVKRILKGFYKAQEIKNENLYLLSDFSYSNNKSIIRNEITNIEFYDILTQLIGKNYKDIEQQIIHEIEEKEKQENLKILKDNKIKNFIYEEEIIFNDLKEKKWSLECKKLDCKIEYGVRKVAHTDDFIIKFNKNIKLTDEIQRDKILKRITEDIKTNNHNNSEFYVYFVLTTENNKKIQIFSNYSNKNFYKILNELLAQDYKNIEKNFR